MEYNYALALFCIFLSFFYFSHSLFFTKLHYFLFSLSKDHILVSVAVEGQHISMECLMLNVMEQKTHCLTVSILYPTHYHVVELCLYTVKKVSF